MLVLSLFWLKSHETTEVSHLHNDATELKSGLVLVLAIAHARNSGAKVQVRV